MIRKGMFINDRYEIIEKVGSGGMSDVYKAKCHKLNRYVAIKVLKQEFSADKNFVSKFRVEAQSAAGLSHPNIVNVYDVGEDKGMYYIVMELIEGITLKQYIQRKGRLTVKEAVSIAIQVAQGIECAHSNKIIHRDIKPQNILISKEGKVKVTDFGIARAASSNTINSNVMGSVHYISPEQARGGYIDEKSDIYSLGITMYEMLTGSVPFEGDTTVSIALMHIQSEVPDIKEVLPDIPISVEKIVYKCTQKKADRRYLKIASLITDLKRALINPDEDFVQIASNEDKGTTILISDDDVAKIRKGSEEKEEEIDDELDNDIDAVNPKFDKIIGIGGAVAGIIVLILAIIIVKGFFSTNDIEILSSDASEESTIDSKSVEMPNLINMTEDEAADTLNENSLGITYEYDYSDEIEKGLVCKQSEVAGNIIPKNTTITVTISKGAESIDVEDLTGLTLEEAKSKLVAKGLSYDIEYEYSSDVDIDTVINTDPSSLSSLKKGDTVTLIVSRGTESSGSVGIKTVTTPTVIGSSESSAKSSIESAGLKVGEIRYEYSDTVDEGNVIRQTVKGGSTVGSNTTVGLVVSKGPEEEETEEELYTGTAVFAPENLLDSDGNQITSGAVSVLVDGTAITVASDYSDVSNWPGDYKVKVTSEVEKTVVVQLLVNGIEVDRETISLSSKN